MNSGMENSQLALVSHSALAQLVLTLLIVLQTSGRPEVSVSSPS